MKIFALYCAIVSLAGIVLNSLFLAVTRLRRLEAFQEVVIFARNISIGYVFVSISIFAIAPQSIVLGTMSICIPRGFVAELDSSLLSIITCFGAGCFMYTLLTMSVMFLFRYNVTCKTSWLSSVFDQKNIFLFLFASAVFSFIESVLLGYSVVDSNYLLESMNTSRQIMNGLDLDILEFGERSLAVLRIVGRHNSSHQVQHNETSSVQVIQEVNGAANSSGAIVINYNDAMASRAIIGVFGSDYSRNPVFFLPLFIFAATSVICSAIVLAVSTVIACKLRGNQESMSEKSKDELRKLSNLLILVAYIPAVLLAIPALNYFYSLVRRESLPFQEYLGMLCIAPIPVIFPLTFIFLIPELRQTTFQLIFCTFWAHRRKATKQKAVEKANENNGEEDLNPDQMKVLKDMSR